MYPSILHVTGVLFLWTSANAVLDCTDTISIQQEQMKCYQKFNIRVGTGDIQSVLQTDAATMCRKNEAEYREILTCAFEIGRRCLIQLSANPDILPSADRVADGIAYMCRQNITAMNPSCVQTAQSAFQTCLKAGAETYARTHSVDTAEKITCAAYQVTYDCMRDTFGRFCSAQFVKIYLTFVNDYMRPPVCGSLNSATHGVPFGIPPYVPSTDYMRPSVLGSLNSANHDAASGVPSGVPSNGNMRPPVLGSLNSATHGVPSVVTMLVATVLGLFVTF